MSERGGTKDKQEPPIGVIDDGQGPRTAIPLAGHLLLKPSAPSLYHPPNSPRMIQPASSRPGMAAATAMSMRRAPTRRRSPAGT